MRSNRSNWRAVLGAILALVFFAAVMPGTMAMPPSRIAAADTKSDCGHMNPVKKQESPCKGMTVCAGLLGCFGLSVIVTDPFAFGAVPPVFAAQGLAASSSGLTHPPDTPPPIA